MKRILTILLAVAVLGLQIALYTSVTGSGEGLTIVVTFPFLYNDAKALACEGDAVVNLVKPGMDPHEYQLTPSDIDLIKKADLIVSTGHTPFEIKIRELASSGQIRARLIELPSIEGMALLRHTQTGALNYHGIQLYPQNYALLIKAIESTLETLRPECAEVYKANAAKMLQELNNLNSTVKKFSKLLAVVDLPPLQYIATWLGLEVKYILVREEGAPIMPQDYIEVEKLLASAKNVVVIATEEGVAETKLRSMSGERGVAFISLPNPLLYNGTLDYLRVTAQIVNNVSLTTGSPQTKGFSISTSMLVGVVVLLAVMVVIALYTWLRR
jgi:zinc/manganese transport system substrate-binding protein